jgi:hypothetical protein
MASTSSATQERELYRLTRSEATLLVSAYMNAKKKGADGSIEPFRVFRDALETAKPAYIGKFNSSSDIAVQGAFYKIATNLFKMLDELNRRAAETDHHTKTMDAAKLLPCKHAIAYLSATFLNWAVYNWYMKKEPIVEDLGDNGYECNRCTICDYEGDSLFYFSTAYGLEKPICEYCLPFDAADYEEEGEYIVEEESEEDSSEEHESEAEVSEEEVSEEEVSDEDDEDYEPSSESEEDDDEDDDENDDESESDPEDGVEGAEPLKYFGCSGCPLEWRAGFKHGYKTAMKEMRKYASEQKHNVPDAPECAVCEDSHEKLKKCGGCGLVRYCSTECQEEDWADHKLVCRR